MCVMSLLSGVTRGGSPARRSGRRRCTGRCPASGPRDVRGYQVMVATSASRSKPRATQCFRLPLSGKFPSMALYMYQASYTAKSMAEQLKEPQDPVDALKSALEDVGATLLVAGFPFGEYDVLVVYEAPDDVTAASVAMAVAAEGEFKSAKTTRLLSGNEWLESLRKRRVVNVRRAR